MIKLIAQAYIDLGFAVVPVVKGKKRASSSWRGDTYTAADFNDGDNIAIKCGDPSGGLVDFDLDCDEAVKAASRLLPNTGMVHGRPGKPNSHYWFNCPGIKTTAFLDVKDAAGDSSMLCEIRSTGGYTVVPPSIWTSDMDKGGDGHTEAVAWAHQRTPLAMLPDDAYNAIRSVAIAAIIARHWPGHGATHAMVGPLAGFLCQGGIESTLVVEIIKTAAWIAGGDERDCGNYASSTVAKFRAGEPVTGGPKLAEAIGVDVVSKIRGWLKLADVDALDAMNAKHFWVRIGKDDVIGREDSDYVIFQRPKSLYSEYANKFVKTGEDKNGDPVFEPLFPAWLKWEKRRSYREVVFTPPPLVASELDYNLWKGFAIAPVEGDCQLFLDHICQIICSGNPEHYDFLMNLLAFTIQEPGSPSEVATVLRGETGTGKGLFVRALGDIFGRHHFAHLDKTEQLTGKFNAALSGKIILFADEAFFAGDKSSSGALKRMITEPTIWIERKGIDGVSEDNHGKLFMATNDEWAVPAMLKERRFFCVRVSSARIADTVYFSALADHLKAGGLAAFLHLMLQYPVNRDLLRHVPRTKELRVQQDQTLPLEMQWWQEILFDEKRIGDGFGSWVPVALFFESYDLWVKGRTTRPLVKMEFGRRMSTLFSAEKSKAHRFSGNVERATNLRTLDDARKTFDAALGTETEWPDALGASPLSKIPF